MSKTFNNRFSDYIKDIRLGKNLSLFKVHRLTGFPLAYLEKMENEFKDPPSMKVLKVIAETYEVGLSRILKDTKRLQQPTTI